MRRHEIKGDTFVESLERFAFYERAKKAYAIVATTGKGAK
jgi:L-fucose mutarotase/ribose pyranase (RbsD/FucU family)